jgi:short-subunit dehydrogenase
MALTALITGGSSGIGRAIADVLAEMGHNLILVSEDGPGLKKAERQICTSFSVSILTLQFDLAKHDAATNLFETCQAKGLQVDVLVNCAGIFTNQESELEDLERVRVLLALHVEILTQLCLRFGKLMIERKRGYILNISSISSLFQDPSSMVYGPSKRYVLAFSKSLHSHWREHNVKVTCVVPGGVRTTFFKENDVYLPPMVARHLMPADEFSRAAVRALFKGRRVLIPGLTAKLHALFFRSILRPALYGPLKRMYLSMRRNTSR